MNTLTLEEISKATAINQVRAWGELNRTKVSGIISTSHGFKVTTEIYDALKPQLGAEQSTYFHTYLSLIEVEGEDKLQFVFINSIDDSVDAEIPANVTVSDYDVTTQAISIALGQNSPHGLTHSKALSKFNNWSSKRGAWVNNADNPLFRAFQNPLTDLIKLFEPASTAPDFVYGFIALRDDNVPELIFCPPTFSQYVEPADVSYPVPPFGQQPNTSPADFQLYIEALPVPVP